MKYLTGNQINYLKGFFGEDNENVANKLLTTGKCVVAGDGKLWHGGIGNFIRITDAEDFVDCKHLNFDVDEFLSSEWFKESLQNEIQDNENIIDSLKAKQIELKLLKI